VIESDRHYKGAMVVIFVIAVFGLIYAFILSSAYEDCDKRGGRLVEGILWYECVQAAP
jgi:hypothetical protein